MSKGFEKNYESLEQSLKELSKDTKGSRKGLMGDHEYAVTPTDGRAGTEGRL